MADELNHDLTELTVELLSAFVAKNSVRSDDLPALIASTHAALSGLAPVTAAGSVEAPEVHKSAVTTRKSLANRDFLISMIDGKPYKSLKRHLTGHGLTPQTYRERYQLPTTYPMVAPGYSEARREVAKRLGLGRKSKPADVAVAAKPARKPRGPNKPKATATDAAPATE